MNTALSISNWCMGDRIPGMTNRGKKARKKMESFGFRMLIKKPLSIIWNKPFLSAGLLNSSAP